MHMYTVPRYGCIAMHRNVLQGTVITAGPGPYC